MINATSTKKWYHTTGGAIFLGIIIFFIVVGLIFFGLVTYYSWQLKYGNHEKLAQEFTSTNIIDTNVADSPKAITEDITKFIYPGSPKFGPDKAPVTILAFIDFECPFSQQSYPIFKQVMDKYGSAIKVVFKHLPISANHTFAAKAHMASACAQEQNKFWEYYDLLFSQKQLDEASLIKYANELKLNNDQFTKCLNSDKFANSIDKDLTDSATLEVRGTPTYFVNQKRVEGVLPLEDWGKIILEQLSASK